MSLPTYIVRADKYETTCKGGVELDRLVRDLLDYGIPEVGIWIGLAVQRASVQPENPTILASSPPEQKTDESVSD